MALFPYTFQNHFQFGYRDPVTLETRWLDRRRSDDEEFVATYGRAFEEVVSWRAANTLAAEKIIELAQKNGLTPVVCYSGGLDSEVTLVAMMEAMLKLSPDQRIPIEVATLIDDHGLNQHDVDYVEKFRKARESEWRESGLSVSFESYPIDIEAFLKSDTLQSVFEETQMLSPVLNSHIHLFQKIFERSPRSLPILGQGELYLSRENSGTSITSSDYPPASWSVVETENLCGLFRYFIGRGRPAVPGFFQYLPEQFEAQLRTNAVLHELISNSRFGKLGTRTSKAEIIAFDYPELEARPKFTGFEKIEALHDEIRGRYGRKHPALESKWSMGVYDLMQGLKPQSLRPQGEGSVLCGDWRFGWGQTSDVASSRGSADDFFATEWSPDPRETPAASSGARQKSLIQNFGRVLREFAADDAAILHDGSLVARVFSAALGRKHEADIDIDTFTENLKASDIARWRLAHGALDSESLALTLWADRWTKSESLLIPRLQTRFVNAEYDRSLEVTLTKPRFVWTENERMALMTNALAALDDASNIANRPTFLQPWTSSKITSLIIDAVRNSGWLESDEPGPAATRVVDDFLEAVLRELGETPEMKSYARERENQFSKLRSKIETLLKQCHLEAPRYFTSPRSLDRRPSEISNRPLSVRLSDLAFHGKSLKAVEDSVWLGHARVADPDIALPSNLFFAQTTEGFQRLDKNLRSSFARTHRGEDVAWAHLSVQSLPPFGRLRIRGVTVRPDLLRRGHATELIRSLAEACKTLLPIGFSGIDVFAAPNVVTAFLRAGFIEDVKRVTRKEETVDHITGQLVATDRDLTPLSLEFES